MMRQTRLDEGLGTRPPAVERSVQEQPNVNGGNTDGGQAEGEGAIGRGEGRVVEDPAQTQTQVGNGEEDEEDVEMARVTARQKKREELNRKSKAAAQEMERSIADLELSGDGEEFVPGPKRVDLPQLRGEEDRTPPRGIASRSSPWGRPVDGTE
jgi:hypothetical protein